MKSFLLSCLLFPAIAQGNDPEMHWADASNGRPFSKDPSVIRFGEACLMSYSLPAEKGCRIRGLFGRWRNGGSKSSY